MSTEKEVEREYASSSALGRAARHWGMAPKLVSFVGKNAETLISTDEGTTSLLLIQIFEPHKAPKVIAFSDILDTCCGENATVTVSGGGISGSLNGVPISVGSASVNRSVSSRWLNIFVNDSLEPRITLYMPSEATAQQWYDLLRLGIARSRQQKTA